MKHFDSFGAFAAHLARLAAAGPAVTHHLADEAAAVVEAAARAKIGHYQPAAGPFAAWAPLKPETVAEKVRLGFTEDAPLLRTGEMYASIGRTVQGDSAVIGSTDEKAVFHEFGTSHLPPRPFLGPAAFESRDEIERRGGATLAAWVAGIGWARPRLPGGSR